MCLTAWLFSWGYAQAYERCALGIDVPRAIHIPGIIVLVLRDPQCFGVYENGTLSTRRFDRPLYGWVSTGGEGHDTPITDPSLGAHRIHFASEHHFSTQFSMVVNGREEPAYMPQALFFNKGIALHTGRVTTPFASHGCVRLPKAAAHALFYNFPHDEIQVIVAEDKESFKEQW